MPIPENQLRIWAQPGTVKGAKNTHAAICNALARHDWPGDVRYRTYLQGSYRNNTHRRRQSDVDVVVELTSLYPTLDSARNIVTLRFRGVTPVLWDTDINCSEPVLDRSSTSR